MLNTLRGYVTAYRNKITKKFLGVVHVKHAGRKKGDVLLSFVAHPFTLVPGEFLTDPHSNNWTAPEIARLFSERGYDVDVIDWNNTKFVPRKKYAACIDLCNNLENLASFLTSDCKKIMFIIGSHPEFQNTAENKRISALEKRRGVVLPPKRTVPNIRNAPYVDFIAGYGNETVHGTFSPFHKKVIPIPVPAMDAYDFPKDKNFDITRRHFLWFGGGGSILKGLDLVIEAFSRMPQFTLTIVGPSAYEKDLEKIYAKELALPNIKRYGRPKLMKDSEIITDGKNIREIFNECGAVVYVSASEGGGGAVVHAMQAGVFPIVTPQTGIDERAPSIVIKDPTIENICKAVLSFSELPPEKVRELSKETWSFAQKHHSKEAFTRSFEDFIDNELKM